MKRILKSKNHLRLLRHNRIRKVVKGTSTTPRLSVFRGLRSISLQLIDDSSGKTLCAAKSSEIKKSEKVEGKTTKVALGYLTGKLLATRAAEKGIKSVVFDRGGYRYHGRVAAVADGAREGGLQF
jgi:large subunit ribosomal protein L18